ncbi:hypothetical protein R1flu_028701 [Riccia fluitans]|uniref:THIF-type NAD/FAD binding fold domain-containing protein n=1 Tax=Riccia fluitans TaxID=41844 RepID=A0ABD1XN36_9MARC
MRSQLKSSLKNSRGSREEIRELRNGLDVLDKVQGAVSEGQKELADEVQEKNIKQGEKVQNNLEPPNQTDRRRRLATCGLDYKSCFASGHSMSAGMIHLYSRQLLVLAFGVSGQEELSKLSVLVVGLGGLGSPVALNRAFRFNATGVGKLGPVDNVVVELSSLHRQVLHGNSYRRLHWADKGFFGCISLSRG